MPAGDLVVSDYQLELRGTLMGAGTDYVIDVDRGALGGLFDSVVAEVETEYLHAAGSYIGDEFEAARTATAAIVILGTTPAIASAGMMTMRTTWAPSTTDQQLWFQVPGVGKKYVVGRPRGIVVDHARVDSGAIPILATFRISDPVIRP